MTGSILRWAACDARCCPPYEFVNMAVPGGKLLPQLVRRGVRCEKAAH